MVETHLRPFDDLRRDSDGDGLMISIIIASFFSAVCAALGLGGGTVLMLYFALLTEIPQQQAQGINLLLFLPVAALSLWFHTKNKLVAWKQIIWVILCGLPGVFLGCWLSEWLDVEWLRKAFGGFLLLMGIHELLAKSADKNSKKDEQGKSPSPSKKPNIN